MNGLTEKQMEVLRPALDQFVEIIVEKVYERLLSEMNQQEPKLYTRTETANILHVTLPTLAKITKQGMITPTRIGRRVLYDAESIDAIVNENRKLKYNR